jgi:flagellar basal body-associated protein FliL
MEDSYQEVPYSEPEPKKGMSGWLIALIIIAVLFAICCLCLLLSFLLLGPAVGNVFSTIVETVEATTPMP